MKHPRKKAGNDPMPSTLVQVAHLYYDENLSQLQIADRLGVSRSLIAEYLRRAREAGIVRIQILDPTSTSIDLADALKKATGIQDIVVIPNPRGSQTLTLRAVSMAAADFLVGELSDGDAFGLAWGRTTAQVVELLGEPRARRIDVLPLMGESGHTDLHSQMNRMVMQAAGRLRAKAHFLSLPMVLSSPELRNALLQEVGFEDVFDFWNRTRVACFGVGVVPPVPGMVVYIGEEHLPGLVNAGAVGDLCGIYFDREGRILHTGLENRMIAASADQIRKIERRVAVACGADKATAVLGAVRTGLINTLFIDQAMAERILADLGAD